MRPFPESRHPWAVAVIVAVAAATVALAVFDPSLSIAQYDMLAAALKHNQGELFPYDGVFGPSRLWQFHTPIFQMLMDLALVPEDYHTVAMPLWIMAGLAMAVYLCGMYALLYRQTRSWSVSLFVAVLSAAVVHTLKPAFWGIGAINTITPPGLFLSVTPLIVLAYLTYENRWQLLLVFGFIGLMGNLHLMSAMNLTLILLTVYLVRQRLSPQSWPMAIGVVLFALLGALPYIAYYLRLRHMLAGPHMVSMETARQAFALANLEVLYPSLLRHLLGWLPILAGLLVPAAVVLSQVKRYRARDVGMWVYFAAAGMIVCVGFQGASQLIGQARQEGPPVIDFMQASSLVMLPLYVLLAQAITNLFRIARGYHGLIRTACVALMILWYAQSDNCRGVRHAAYELATAFVAEVDKPARVQEVHANTQKFQELQAMARWAQRETDLRAVFLNGTSQFRTLSRRSIFVSPDDVKYYYYLQPNRLPRWIQDVEDQERLLDPSAGAKIAAAQVRDMTTELARRSQYAGVPAWYAIIEISAAPDSASPMTEISNPAWGRSYKLYRVR